MPDSVSADGKGGERMAEETGEVRPVDASRQTYQDLERQKWEAWAAQCDVKSGLIQDMCFLTGDKCRQARCPLWKWRAFLKSEPWP